MRRKPRLAVPSYGAMALKHSQQRVAVVASKGLAVPSYGAMALKQPSGITLVLRPRGLAVPSYGAMALKPQRKSIARGSAWHSCSPLLRGDGPETLAGI